MRDRAAIGGPIAAAAAILGLCCGLPVLLSIGVVGAIAGWSLQSWVLIGFGLAVAAFGWARRAAGRRDDERCRRSGPYVHAGAAPDQNTDSATDATTRGTRL